MFRKTVDSAIKNLNKSVDDLTQVAEKESKKALNLRIEADDILSAAREEADTRLFKASASEQEVNRAYRIKNKLAELVS